MEIEQAAPMATPKTLVIYHGNCADGFTSAWVAWRALPPEHDVIFYPATYGTPCPHSFEQFDCILVLDFCYPLDEMQRAVEACGNVIMLDHHITAQPVFDQLMAQYPDHFMGVFDNKRSGALITWDWFFPDYPAPMLVKVVSDRDLWKFSMAHTKAVMAAIFSHAYDFQTWNDLYMSCENSLNTLVAEGEAIMRKHDKDIAELLGTMQWEGELGANGITCLFCNIPYVYSSEAGHKMCAEAEKPDQVFACCYWEREDGRIVASLRSVENGPNVAAIAKDYMGGGHAHAAGFTVTKAHWEIITRRASAPASLRNSVP